MSERGPRLNPIEQSGNDTLQIRLHRRAVLRGALGIGVSSLIGGGAMTEGATLGSEELRRPKPERSKKILGTSASAIIGGVVIATFGAVTGRSTIKDAINGLEDASRDDERKRK